MIRRRCSRLVLAPIILPLLVWGYDRALTIHWVGSTDLEVEFVVTDAAIGGPLSNARVEIQSQDCFDAGSDEQTFELAAGADGVARKEYRQRRCFGTQSGLRFTDTFVVRLPLWQYRVVAGGYTSTEWTDFDVSELRQLVQRAGPGKSRLVVRVALHNRPH